MSRPKHAELLERALRQIRRAKAEIAESRRPPTARCPIAILGFAGRLPGADDVDAFWQNLLDGVDAIGPIPSDRWDVEANYDPEGRDPRKMHVRTGGFVRDVAGFDPEFFGISPREALTLDPQQRLMLEVTWHALEHAGLPPGRLHGAPAGVYLGVCANEYVRVIEAGAGVVDSFSGTSNALSVIAGRVAYTLGFEGPAVALDTACSSSLVAIHLAVRALQVGDCALAVAGGVNTILHPLTMVGMSRLNMLSPTGRCRSFDADADGFARGEGCGIIVLKRLDDAQRDGDRVRAVIRGSAVNQDGRSAGITAPNKHAQVAAMRAALADGALEPHGVTYLESHGTGTGLGDPIEMGAIAEVLCADRAPERPLLVGAAKSCIGHLEAASGVAGLIKAALAIEHGRVPRNLHFETPNPHIPWSALPVAVPTETTPWDPALVGINSFGFSGTNAHLIVGPPPPRPDAATPLPRGAEVLPISARAEGALTTLAARYAERIEAEPAIWPHIARAAACDREPMPQRATVVAADAGEAARRLRALAEGRAAAGAARARVRAGTRTRVGFLFTGQGAQFAGMGRALYAEEPAFAATIDHCAARLDPQLPHALTGLLFDPDGQGRLDQTRFTQPAVFAVQVALLALWRQVGVTPHVVVGHSVGAYAAAVAAGAMTLDDALDLVVERGRLMGELPPGGAMAAVEAPERRVLAAARDARWHIAAVNSDADTVIAGDADAVEAAIGAFAAEGIRARRLAVSHAFHSPHMQPAVEPFRQRAAACPMAAPTIRFIDDRTGALRSRAPTADDWSRHLREPVRFADALRALAAERCDALVEIGPGPVALGLARRVLGDDCPPRLPSMRPGREAAVFAESLAGLWRAGAPVDWAGRFAGRGLRRVDAPRYPFQHRRFWAAGQGGPGVARGAGLTSSADRVIHGVRWRPLAPAPRRIPDGPWRVVGAADDLGPALVDALRGAGLDAEWLPDAPTLLAAPPERGVIVDLAALDAPPFDTVGPEALPEGRQATCDGALAILSALVERRSAARLVLVTRGAVGLGGAPPDPIQAMRWGLGRVGLSEHRDQIGGLIDVDPGPPAGRARALLDALLAADAPPEQALRGGARYAPRLAAHRADPRPVALDAEGAILITGGLGALGLALADRLVARGARHLALMGRRPPSPAAEARIAGWRAAGATVLALAGDVGVAADVDRALARVAEALPPIIGVVHAAGVLDDGLLLDQTPARFDRALHPKALGAWHLHRALGEARFFVLFSSVAALLGSPGQGNYAAANAFLDALAARRHAQGRPALSIAWGPWPGIGMAAEAGRRPSARAGGIEPLQPGPALDAFEAAVAHDDPAAVVMALAPGADPGRNPLFAGWAEPDAPEASGATDQAPAGRLRVEIEATGPDERPALMLGAVVAHIARVLGLEADAIDPGRSAVDLGMDSLLVMEVLDGLKHALGMTLYPREFYQQPSIRAMADYLLDEVAQIRPGRAVVERAPSTMDGGWLASIVADIDVDLDPPEPVDGVAFVLSAPRSGSTLLRVMLQGHPGLFAPPELWLLVADDMAARTRELGDGTLDQGFTMAVRAALGVSTAEAEARVAAMVEARLPIWEAYARLRGWLGGRLLVDKTPSYAALPPVLARVGRWFTPRPSAHLVRHPVAVIDSIMRARLDRLGHGGDVDRWLVAEGIWTRSVRGVLDLAARHPDRPLHTVRYEALVTRPRETVEALCEAWGIHFDPAMLDPYRGDRMTGGLRDGSAPLGDVGFTRHRGIDPALADAWRAIELPRPLHPETRALADALGYELPARRDRAAVPAPQSPDATAEPPREEDMPYDEPSPDGMHAIAAGSTPRARGWTVGGLRLGGLEWGPADGPAVVAVHGLLDHAGVWAPVAERLAGHGVRLVALDLRGHGASDHLGPESGYGPLAYVQDLAAVVDDVAPAAVVGHSLGAAVAALHGVARGAGRPRVLIEPPVPEAPPMTGEALGRWLDARRAPPDHQPLADLDAAVARLAKAMPGVPRPAVRAFAARAVVHGPGGLRWRWDPRLRLRADLRAGGLTAGGWLEALGALDPVPALVFGEDSALMRPDDRARQIAAVGRPATVVPGGHHLPLSAPDVIVDLILAAFGTGPAG